MESQHQAASTIHCPGCRLELPNAHGFGVIHDFTGKVGNKFFGHNGYSIMSACQTRGLINVPS